ncbi:borealin-2 [Latimeria chalumnae]|uniref:borealin-2 n=1 Tax=Latimeria chalumnae TaxID=7897 RepID=UPI0003C148BA|nr:PREDICTED: borealin-2-like [Latimeria chalumnae]|eukprot:XP_006011852.1 PREDICTED: borealin-2-like [Latimeria chalumnae]
MARRKEMKKSSTDSGVEVESRGSSLEQREEKIRLFLQAFDQEVDQRIAEMEQNAEAIEATIEKAFTVELLKMPLAVRRANASEVLDSEENGGAMALAMKVSLIDDLKLGRKRSKKGEREPNGSGSKRNLASTTAKTRTTKVVKTKPRAASSANKYDSQTASFGSVVTTPVMKKSMKTTSSTTGVTRKTTSRFNRRLPEASLGCAHNGERTMWLNRSVPFVNIPLADGQALCLQSNDINNVDVELLQDIDVQHIQTFADQLIVLCGKAIASQVGQNI